MFKVRLEYLNRFGIVLSNFTYRIPKIHTLREDKNDRWTKGIMIDFFINSRTKDMFRFAPRLPVVSTQDVFMTMIHGRFEVTIDDTYLYYPEKLKLAQNDGFETVEEFERFFFPDGGKTKYEASLKLIHWTDFRYGE
ncbi:hypothetical protein KRR40_12500 [Niabella defluvii]|nr:hypothetical protein KRR40_12500 [Niabella sp. I65]